MSQGRQGVVAGQAELSRESSPTEGARSQVRTGEEEQGKRAGWSRARSRWVRNWIDEHVRQEQDRNANGSEGRTENRKRHWEER